MRNQGEEQEVITEVINVGGKNNLWKYFGIFIAVIIFLGCVYFIFLSDKEKNSDETDIGGNSFLSSIIEVFGNALSDTFSNHGENEELVEIVDSNIENNSFSGVDTDETIVPDNLFSSGGDEGQVDEPALPNQHSALKEQAIQDFSKLEIEQAIYDVDGRDEGNERVTISNHGSIDINLSNLSLQYLSSDRDFADINKRNFESGSSVPAGGTFVVGMNCHIDAPCSGVDMSWSQALNNTSGTIFIVRNQEKLIGVSDPDIIDLFQH